MWRGMLRACVACGDWCGCPALGCHAPPPRAALSSLRARARAHFHRDVRSALAGCMCMHLAGSARWCGVVRCGLWCRVCTATRRPCRVTDLQEFERGADVAMKADRGKVPWSTLFEVRPASPPPPPRARIARRRASKKPRATLRVPRWAFPLGRAPTCASVSVAASMPIPGVYMRA